MNRAQNCINIHSNCIIMQFWRAAFRCRVGGDGWRIFQVETKNIWNCIPIIVTLHRNSCNFALQKMQLCIPMVASLHPNGCFFALLPLLNFLEAKYLTFFFLLLIELHSVAENFTFLTKINYIPYENTLHSLPECTSFS